MRDRDCELVKAAKNEKSLVTMSSFDRCRVFHIDDLSALQLGSTSKGNQQKWYCKKTDEFVKGQFYYQGKYWKDNLVEVIASKLAEQMNLNDVSVVKQETCVVSQYDGVEVDGVCSKNFCKPGQRFVSAARLDPTMEDRLFSTRDVEERWNIVSQTIQKITGLNYESHLAAMCLIDYLVGNEDRHLNNFGVLLGSDGFSPAPLFDFGLGLFEHDRRYEGLPFRDCIKKMQCKPFHADNQKVIDFLANQRMIDGMLPAEFDLTGVELPSPKAGSYLRNRCMHLNVDLKGVR